jgi:hypothetical protein
MDPGPRGAVIPAGQEEEAAKMEMASVFEEIAAHNAAMSEVEVSIAPNAVVTVELAAIKIALTVVQDASVPEIVAIKPPILAVLVASNVAVPVRLIVERAALRSLGEVRGAGWAVRRAAEVRGARWAVRHAAEVRGTGRAAATPATASRVPSCVAPGPTTGRTSNVLIRGHLTRPALEMISRPANCKT